MPLYLEVKADTNDGDYVMKRSKISEKQLDGFRPLILAIKARGKQGHNWAVNEYSSAADPNEMYGDDFSAKTIERFSELVPTAEDPGVHTIVSITVLHVQKEEVLI